MIISVWGKAGSGKSTCTKLLSEKIGYQRISIGDMRRAVAEEMGISIQEFNILGDLPENEETFDRAYDRYQQSLSLYDNIILESRLWFWNQPQSLKVFLDVDDLEWARRILGDSRTTDNHASIEETARVNRERNSMDAARYIRLYGSNPRDLTNYDLIIDTTNLSPEEVVEQIIASLSLRNQILSS